MMIQLQTPVPLETTRGPGFAHFLIDYGQEHHLLWVVFLNESGECWTLPNKDVRLSPNETMGVRMPAKSQAQRALLYSKFGAAWVKAHGFDNKGKLPKHVKKAKKKTTKKKSRGR